ncbi:GntR family transcriptional regulator, partial [Klebsiella pneumoniae]|uniref:GntR family transcriptional regulator n=1 Tax=Klebsiella pneumoniae TaxID=573 RepID=UPI001D117E52
MPAFEWVHVQLHQQKGMISLSPPTICNSALPGARLSERELTSQLDISRNTLREVFRLLTQEGLLRYQPNRG